ncbi:MAG TPA: nitrate reductase molybdenum cofactor assembly chaperone [Burkholderiales bacterium]|jgi:nitrate reductase delta subunit|nr:nitrate reductase molybdenum cofactor assembly chaperone [Burkholderiales bacterium]
MKTNFRALAALLSYPEPELVEALEEIRQAAPQLSALIDELETEPLDVLQERYVALFDRSRALSLHLFEHVHGESRDRGQAMVDLARTYASRGFRVAGNELPDYLPAFLEFISLLPPREGRSFLNETSGILRALGDRLATRGSRYAEVFAALLAAGGEPGLTKAIAPRPVEGEESSPAAIDKAWMDEPVTFGGTQPVKFYARGARP